MNIFEIKQYNVYEDGEASVYAPKSRRLDLGASCLPPIEVPVEDRNRTSPFCYGTMPTDIIYCRYLYIYIYMLM